MEYNKLVRDKIPEIIQTQGEIPHFCVLNEEEFSRRLEQKLDEEVEEFHREANIEELADILEVVFALAENLGSNRDELIQVYRKKHEARGGFRDRILLISKDA